MLFNKLNFLGFKLHRLLVVETVGWEDVPESAAATSELGERAAADPAAGLLPAGSNRPARGPGPPGGSTCPQHNTPLGMTAASRAQSAVRLLSSLLPLSATTYKMLTLYSSKWLSACCKWAYPIAISSLVQRNVDLSISRHNIKQKTGRIGRHNKAIIQSVTNDALLTMVSNSFLPNLYTFQ